MRDDFRIFCYSAKNARKKANKGFHPLTPLRSRRLFKSRRGSFLLANETPMEHGFHRLVVFYYPLFFLPHHGGVVGVWFYYNFPMMWEQIVSHEGWVKTDGGGQGGGRMRRIYAKA